MPDLPRALERLVAALGAGETIGVFGDYDVDGVTTAAVLASAFRAMGGKVIPRAASRHAGYGVGVEDVARFAADGCRVLVTGDCGTSDHDALAAARERGIDVIVIDHHELPAAETPAYALINSRRPDDAFPFKGLASCGVAFYLAAALRTRLGATFDPRDLLDLVALGTIADLVPLTDENRILVAAGLKVLSARKRPGLAALAVRAELTEGPITAHQAAFRLTPRLNAAGRLGEAQLALDLLLATPADAERLAAAHRRAEHRTAAHPGAGLDRGAGPGRRTGRRAGHRRRSRGVAPRRGRDHRRASGRRIRAPRDRDRVQGRRRAGLGAHGRRRQPVRRARRVPRAPHPVRRPRGRRGAEHRRASDWTTSARRSPPRRPARRPAAPSPRPWRSTPRSRCRTSTSPLPKSWRGWAPSAPPTGSRCSRCAASSRARRASWARDTCS